jgi:hypothetical protein
MLWFGTGVTYMKCKRMLQGLVLATAGICARASVAQAGAVGSDFSMQGGGGWSYGYYASGLVANSAPGAYNPALPDPNTFTLFNSYTASPGVAGLPGLEEWKSVPTPPGDNSNGTDPNVIYNNSGTDQEASFAGDIDFQAHTLNVGPWYGPTVVRYTAPYTGLYDVSASFQTVQIANTAPIAYVYFGTTLEATSPLTPNLNPGPQFGDVYTPFNDVSESLTKGETVDFVVYGNDTNNKTTLLSAAVVAPLPMSVWAGLGLIGSIGAFRLMRKQTESAFA